MEILNVIKDKEKVANVERSNLVLKESHRKIDSSYNIKFTVDYKMFRKLVEYLSNISNNVVFKFEREYIKMFTLDPGKTHLGCVLLNKSELSSYEKSSDDVIEVIVDISIMDNIKSDRVDSYSIHFDTLNMNKMYVACGKEVDSILLGARDESLIEISNSGIVSIGKVMSTDGIGKVTVANETLLDVLSSISKKKIKKKTSRNDVIISMNRENIEFKVISDTRSSSVLMDEVVEPPTVVNELILDMDIIKKYSIDVGYQTTIWYKTDVPIVLYSKINGVSSKPMISGDDIGKESFVAFMTAQLMGSEES